MLDFFIKTKGIQLRLYSVRIASSIFGGGGLIFICSCSALLIYFEIDCFYGL
jgi:hypothetical protein